MKKLTYFLSRLVAWLITMGCMAMILLPNSHMLFQLNTKDELSLVWYILSLAAGFLLGDLLQPIGMLLFGPGSGYTLVELSLFGLGWHRGRDGELRFCYRKPIRRFCHLQKPPAYDGSSSYRLYVMGGTLLSALLSGMALLAFALFRSIPEMLYLASFGLGLLMVTLTNLIPDERKPLGLVRKLNRSLHHRLAREHHMFVHTSQRQDFSLIDMPEDFCRPYPEELWCDPLVLGAQHNYASRMLAESRYAEAHDIFARLDAYLSQPSLKMYQKDVTRLFVTCGGAIAEMLCGAPAKFSERINEPNIELFLGRGGWASQLLLAQYLRELLITHDDRAAKQRLTSLEQLPTPLTAGQRRILAEAQAMAASHSQEVSHEE